MKNMTKGNMPTAVPINESGASIVMNELNVLSTELTEVVNRCASRIAPILRADAPDVENPCTHKGLESELFTGIYRYATDCRMMIAQLHSILDRVDL